MILACGATGEIWNLTSPFVSWCNECLSFPHSINHPISNDILLNRQMLFFLKDKYKFLKITYYIGRTIKMHSICFEKYNWASIEIQFIKQYLIFLFSIVKSS